MTEATADSPATTYRIPVDAREEWIRWGLRTVILFIPFVPLGVIQWWLNQLIIREITIETGELSGFIQSLSLFGIGVVVLMVWGHVRHIITYRRAYVVQLTDSTLTVQEHDKPEMTVPLDAITNITEDPFIGDLYVSVAEPKTLLRLNHRAADFVTLREQLAVWQPVKQPTYVDLVMDGLHAVRHLPAKMNRSERIMVGSFLGFILLLFLFSVVNTAVYLLTYWPWHVIGVLACGGASNILVLIFLRWIWFPKRPLARRHEIALMLVLVLWQAGLTAAIIAIYKN
ncbi:MAG: hypothetical protein JXA10_13850 [Anaerolineae bacterium]|nr:hypothetical protein [Anaerolineae bacterium]